MPTLGEACHQLRIGRVTLAKWIKRLGIETTRHEWDWRYEVIAPEDVERIADARKKLPQSPRAGITGAFIPSSSLPAFDRRQSDSMGVGMREPAITPTSRQRPLQPRPPRIASEGDAPELPDGLMSMEQAAMRHGIPPSNVRYWVARGMIESDPGSYQPGHGRFAVNNPLTRRGLAQLYALGLEWEAKRAGRIFQRCPDCPHEESEQIAE